MGVTKDTISNWFDKGVHMKATHMLVVCDEFDYSDFPVYVTNGRARARADELNGEDMTRVLEVYNLVMDKEDQLAEASAFHYDR